MFHSLILSLPRLSHINQELVCISKISTFCRNHSLIVDFMLANDMELLSAGTKELYPSIAKKFNLGSFKSRKSNQTCN